MFSQNLKKLRLEGNMTQSEVAKYLNISRVAYTNYELGNREPDFETLKKIAVLFNTSTDRILDGAQKSSGLITCNCGCNTQFNNMPDDVKDLVKNYSQLSAQGCEDLRNFMELLKVEENIDSRTM